MPIDLEALTALAHSDFTPFGHGNIAVINHRPTCEPVPKVIYCSETYLAIFFVPYNFNVDLINL